jgi:hypothetical protein
MPKLYTILSVYGLTMCEQDYTILSVYGLTMCEQDYTILSVNGLTMCEQDYTILSVYVGIWSDNVLAGLQDRQDNPTYLKPII